MPDRIIAYGGQAVMEGVLMRGQHACAIAMRLPNGDIAIHKRRLGSLYASPITRIPFVRGVILLWDALFLGTQALAISANAQGGEEEKLEGPALVLTLGFSLLIGIALFFALPAGLGVVAEQWLLWSPLASNLAEGVIRLFLMIGYLWAIGRMSAVRRVFQYHGAEHKTINAFEAGAQLTPEIVQQYSLEHPRCGTAFLLTLILLSILVFAVLGPMPAVWRVASRIVLLPLLAGFALEYIRWTANHLGSSLVRMVVRPNLWLQHLTTREPDRDMLEVAITAFQNMQTAELEHSSLHV